MIHRRLVSEAMPEPEILRAANRQEGVVMTREYSAFRAKWPRTG
jgi:hypothetical protein